MSGVDNRSIDELLAQVRAQFTASLPSKIDALEQLVAAGAWGDVRRAAHKLRGSASTYGHVELGAAAAAMEDALLAAADPPDDVARTTIAALLAQARHAARAAAEAR